MKKEILPITKNVIIHEGTVRSKFDTDKHFITVGQLINLYGVLRTDNIIVYKGPRDGISDEQKRREGWIDLYPRYDGKYINIHLTDNIDFNISFEI